MQPYSNRAQPNAMPNDGLFNTNDGLFEENQPYGFNAPNYGRQPRNVAMSEPPHRMQPQPQPYPQKKEKRGLFGLKKKNPSPQQVRPMPQQPRPRMPQPQGYPGRAESYPNEAHVPYGNPHSNPNQAQYDSVRSYEDASYMKKQPRAVHVAPQTTYANTEQNAQVYYEQNRRQYEPTNPASGNGPVSNTDNEPVQTYESTSSNNVNVESNQNKQTVVNLKCSPDTEAYLVFLLVDSLNKGNDGVASSRPKLARSQLVEMEKLGYNLDKLRRNISRNKLDS